MSFKTGYLIVVLWLMSILAQPAYAAEQMCQFCHKPRFLQTATGACKPWMRGGHPIDVVPSARVVIPSALPLNKKTGKLECNTCHLIKRTATSPAKIALRGANVNSSFCKACHNRQNFRRLQQQEIQLEQFDYLPEQVTILPAPAPPDWKQVANHVEDVVLDRVPVAILKAGGRLGSSEDGQKLLICETCHRPHRARTRGLLVMNNSNSQLCATCHSEQSSSNRQEASRKGTHPLNVAPHKDIISSIKKDLRYRGGKLSPQGRVGCLSCHQLHEAAPPTKLLLKGTTTASLCPICHPGQVNSIKGSRHDLTPPSLSMGPFDKMVTDAGPSDSMGTSKIKGSKHDLSLIALREKNMNGQTAEESGICGACHLAHQGQGAKMWAKEVSPGTGDAISSLCLSCHSAGGCAQAKQVGKYSHPVGVSILRAEGNSYQLPLFDENGTPTPGALVTCATCHSVHRTNSLKQAAGAGNFLRVTPADSKLCAGCHKRMFIIAGTEHDPRNLIYKMYSTTRRLPFKPDIALCRACHRVHNANAPMLWTRELGPGKDDISKLCLSCHEFQKVASKKRLTGHSHPIGVSITSLGENVHTPLPLFTRDYKRDPRGRIFCNTCHNTHQRNPMIEQPGKGTAPARDGGNGFLRLVANDSNSTLCNSCHPDKQLIKKSKHNLEISAPQEKNTKGETTKQSGVCGTCHAAHYNSGSKGLWNRELGEGKDPVSQMCNSCHSREAIAEGKQVKPFSHPLNINLSPDMKPRVLPTYNWQLKPVKQGTILCSTCHNVHQAAAQPQGVGAGGGMDDNNFLRLPAGVELCGDCHSSQSLIKGTEHDLRVTAQDVQNWQGKKVEESGVCGACHLVHGAPSQFLLWARKFGPSRIGNWRPKHIGQPASNPDNLGIAVCTSCHAPGECAQNKLPKVALHPDGPLIPQRESLNIQQAPSYPLLFYFYGEFDVKLLMPKDSAAIKARFPVVGNNGRSSPMGKIVCITCHDVHQWSAQLDIPGEGKKLEGREGNSFLRGGVAADFCADCHSQQAIYLFTYYHKPNRGGIIKSMIFAYQQFVADFASSPLGSNIFTELIFRPGGDLPAKCPQCHNKYTSLADHNVLGVVLKGVNTQINQWGRKTPQGNIKVKCWGFHTLLVEKYNSYLLNRDVLPAEDKPEGVCFKCHLLKDFEKLNPHQNQLKEDGSLNTERCLLCHYEVPDPAEERFKLVGQMETYCIGCHNEKMAAHSSKTKHFGQRLPKKALKRWQVSQQQGLFIPLQENIIVCSTCHNTHQPGVLQNDKTKLGEANAHKLRVSVNTLCAVCHQLPEKMIEDMIKPQDYVVD